MDISKENQDYIFDSIKNSNDLENAYHRIHAIYCEKIDSCRQPIYNSEALAPYKINKASYLNSIIAMIMELEKLNNV